MADMNLDDIRGYWRDLTAEAFQEYWSAYQRDVKPDVAHLLLVYRRLITAALFMNHQADKTAPLHGLERGNHFMDLIKASDETLGLKLHACRHFVNDAKHEMERVQEARTRLREPGFDSESSFDVFEINMLAKDSELYDMCRIICDIWKFWIGYFEGTSLINYRSALNAKHESNP